MKSFTDIEQSKKLTEILPLESADMYYPYDLDANKLLNIPIVKDDYSMPCIHCWSLTALLDNIPQVKLDNIKQYDKKLWRCCAYFASDWHNSDWFDNPIDACVEMILKLHV